MRDAPQDAVDQERRRRKAQSFGKLNLSKLTTVVYSGIANVILDNRGKVVPLQINWQSFRVVTKLENA